ncbi:MAG TPA: DUF1801 domain-containing protein [Bacteroidales bacterium]|nr:DUF1801 domain-containing protein [Bacteroidales bacterium]HOE05026.1 DUF1801 domain-containing protein [Bacteroidales bacterium]HQL70044.1 DUF1801 domain-containing protein [Bacteroidales bacterium]
MNEVDLYIAGFPEEISEKLKTIRKIIQEAAPDAVENMAYGMPSYKLKGRPLVYFAAFKNHIGFYATPNAHAEFAQELASYKHGKGSVQFPLDKALPYDLIGQMVEFRVLETNETK